MSLGDMKACIGFGRPEQDVLAELLPVVSPQLGRLADRIYQTLVVSPAVVLALGGEAQRGRLRSALIEWIEGGLRGPHDEEGYRTRAQLDQLHTRAGVPVELLVTAMNVLRRELRGLVTATWKGERAVAGCDAVDRLIDLDLAVLAMRFESDGEQRQRDRERRTQAEKLVAMQTLTAGLAHEVRNPLNAAKLQLELLERRLRRSDAEPRLLESASLVHQEIERLTDLLNEFLDFARPPQLAAGEHDLVGLAGEVIEAERALAADRGVAVELRGDGPLVAWIDPGKIHQVIRNLVRNAVDAAGRGGHVGVELVGDPSTAEIVIRDDGDGIAPDVLPRIWEPFFTTKDGGIGLGMSIVHSLVDLHRGSIDVRTGAGGTAVAVRLRRQRHDG
jgi:signal transduction histidine kinase